MARSHNEAEAESLVKRASKVLRLPSDQAGLAELTKGDLRKVLVATLVREHTAVSNRWLAERLAMGHTGGLSRLIGKFKMNKENVERLSVMNEMFKSDT